MQAELLFFIYFYWDGLSEQTSMLLSSVRAVELIQFTHLMPYILSKVVAQQLSMSVSRLNGALLKCIGWAVCWDVTAECL
jgi:hypothetical protein